MHVAETSLEEMKRNEKWVYYDYSGNSHLHVQINHKVNFTLSG